LQGVSVDTKRAAEYYRTQWKMLDSMVSTRLCERGLESWVFSL